MSAVAAGLKVHARNGQVWVGDEYVGRVVHRAHGAHREWWWDAADGEQSTFTYTERRGAVDGLLRHLRAAA